ncbi:cell wall hydrolase [Paracoccus albicereus]|nr:cell wall hydrolase [Paracoccus albicereus]
MAGHFAHSAALHGIELADGDFPDRDTPRVHPLRFADAKPAQVRNGPEQVYLARATQRFSEADLACLTEALYFEARGEGKQGQAAVAEVILNRVDSRAFPSSVCGVVNQQSQFSYTIGGKKRIGNKAAYLRVRNIAEAALSGAPRTLTNGATYFHTPSVRPAWSHRFQRTVQIGRHIFYRSGQRLASN